MLTRTEQKVLDAIRTGILECGRSPSYERIARATGLKSKGRVCEIIASLVSDGVLVRHAHTDGRRRHQAIAVAPDRNTVALQLEPDMVASATYLADLAKVTVEAILIEALRDRLLFAKSSVFVTREKTSDGLPKGQPSPVTIAPNATRSGG